MKKIQNINSALIILAVFSGFMLLFLIFRNAGVYLTLTDESTYSKLARLLPMSESTIPDYLYLKLFSITNYCGDSFLGCAKLINAILFVFAIPFIFLISRSVASNGVSLVVTILAVCGPINTYTAYFMPESFVFLGFWVFCWFFIKLNSESEQHHWCAAGVCYGIFALIKPHAIFYLPAIIAYIAFVFFCGKQLFSRRPVVTAILFILGFLLAKFIVSYILAGKAGITFFGSQYAGLAPTVLSFDRCIELLLLALESLKGHVLVICLLYGLPVTIAVSVIVRALSPKKTSGSCVVYQASQIEKISFLSLIVILNLIFVVALFTASVVNLAPSETPYRLHIRYYNFALPLFYIVAAGALSAKTEILNKQVRYVFGCIVAFISAFAIYTNLVPYTPNFFDSPEVSGLIINVLAFKVIGGLMVLTLAVWIVFKRKGIQLYLFLALPLFTFTSSYYVAPNVDGRMSPDVYNAAGIFAKQYLSSDDLSKTVIVGSEPSGLYRSLFYLDNPKSSVETIPSEADYDLSTLTPGKEWVLIIGDHEIVGKVSYQFHMNGFSLVHIGEPGVVDFKRSAWPWAIRKARGLASPESWGTWSNSDVVTFEFTEPLPDKFDLHLIAHAFGPNVGMEFQSSVGTNVSKFKLAAIDEERIVSINNAEGSRIIRINIPNPTSPKALGLSSDERNLGIAFVEMKIVPVDKLPK